MTDQLEETIDIAHKAMQTGLALEFEYDGEPRLVEIHAIGVSTAGKPCLRGYQTTGGSRSGETEGWKMFSIGKIESPHLLDIKALTPREGYQKGDRGMKEIFFEL